MTERRVKYFDKPGRRNTDSTLKAVNDFLGEIGCGDPVHRFGVVLSGLELGTIPLERLFGNFWPFGLAGCSFSVQLDIQSAAANVIVTA